MIRFSVIIPMYNKASFVRKTVESVLDQTFKNFEIIVVNDGSTDNSLAVVSEIKDSRIHIFNKENEGVSVARNFGIEKSQNEYIIFLDADDLWFPDYLETIKEMIEQYPQAGVFATGITDIYSKDNVKDNINNRLIKGSVLLVDNYCKSLIKDEILQLNTGTVCVKRKLFSKVGVFREGVKRGEDIDMWLRLSFVSPIIWKNESKAVYNRISENNATYQYDSLKYDFPYWEWYGYGSSIYLKMYTNCLLKYLFKQRNFRDKIFILFKINWLYVLMHFFYFVGNNIKKYKYLCQK